MRLKYEAKTSYRTTMKVSELKELLERAPDDGDVSVDIQKPDRPWETEQWAIGIRWTSDE